MRYTFTPPQPKISAALEGHYCTGVFTDRNGSKAEGKGWVNFVSFAYAVS